MAFPIVRQGDMNAAGGSAMAPRIQILSSGQPLAAYASPVSPHPCCGAPGCSVHCAASITGGSTSVFASGLPVHKVSDVDTCGHPRVQGDTRVLVMK